eukprot:TRINITY_DN1394_c0_g2_i1.p1 TRINITY_DN1394_c0_g2~~TRINITY_DN1394_c0_g2_i1.p1  ORF type:complete len:300 (-),score=64.11 TRINITY_DN1394_c0_g2_i1:241-1140(-)
MMERPGFLVCTNPNCRCEKGFREDLRTGDIVCTLCGRVACEKTIDYGSEWRNFSDSGGDKSRAENVDDVIDKLTTSVKPVKGADKHSTAMARLQANISGNEQKTLSQASSKISEIADGLGLKDDVKKRAKQLYKEFETKKTRKIRGSNGDAIIVAILYLACKELGVSRTFKELSKETGAKEQEIKKMYLVLTKQLRTTSRASPVAPHELVIRICSNLELPGQVKSVGEHIAKKGASKLEGKSPSSIAAASIYMAVRHLSIPCSEKDIAKAASISPSTVKNIFKEMEPWSDELLPPLEKS